MSLPALAPSTLALCLLVAGAGGLAAADTTHTKLAIPDAGETAGAIHAEPATPDTRGIADTTPADPARQLPVWETLLYSVKVRWVTATTQLRLTAIDSTPGQWLLQATSSVGRNTEQVDIRLDAQSLGLLHRSRHSQGRNQRLKEHHYGPNTVLRVRKEPAGRGASAPADWPESSRATLPIPMGAMDGSAANCITTSTITDSRALLLLAAALPGAGHNIGTPTPCQTPPVLVHTDFNFYRVRLEVGAATQLALKQPFAFGATTLQGTRPVRPVHIRASAVEGNPDPPDFNLLGLGGEVTISFDQATGLPLAITGRAPRVGTITLQLVGATPRGRGL